MNRNYQLELEQIINRMQREETIPRLLLHSCCAPCSSYCMEYLSKYFSVTVFYYNPNITDKDEYRKRVEEQKRLILELPAQNPISFLEGNYEPELFFEMAKGMENLPEGKERCFKCYQMRLLKTAQMAELGKFDYFTTTLTISPMKNAAKLNEIGEAVAESFQVQFLNSDFKKKNGYARSVQMSDEYGLYRQNFCGCIYSKIEAEKRNN